MDDVVFFSVFFRNLELLDKIRNETQSALSVEVAMGKRRTDKRWRTKVLVFV